MDDKKLLERQLDIMLRVLKGLLWGFVICSVLTFFTGCATTRKTSSNVEVHHGDSLRALAVQYDAISSQLSRYDSLLSQMQQQTSLHQTTDEQSTEHIQETVTTWLDSLGREVRQENRTIDRSLARQIEMRYEQQIATMQQQLSRQDERYDSLANELYMVQQVNWMDSINQQSIKEPASTRSSIWMRIHDFITALVNVIVFAVIIGCILRWRKK